MRLNEINAKLAELKRLCEAELRDHESGHIASAIKKLTVAETHVGNHAKAIEQARRLVGGAAGTNTEPAATPAKKP